MTLLFEPTFCWMNLLTLPLSFIRISFLLLAFFAGAAFPVFAANVANLYQASVPVSTQGGQEQKDAFAQGFEQVLVKLTGSYSLIAESGINQSLSRAERYVQRYSYRDNPEFVSGSNAEQEPSEALPEMDSINTNEPPLVAETDEVPVEPFILDVAFSAPAVDSLLSEFSLPIWGSVRPSILAWVVFENEGQRSLLGASDEQMSEDLLKFADQRGLPVFLPVADLADLAKVDVNNLWGLFPDAVEEASVRYAPDSEVLVRVRSDAGSRVSAEWYFEVRGTPYSGSAESNEGTEALWDQLTGHIAREMADFYAVKRSPEQGNEVLKVEVRGIADFNDYADLQNYLLSLPTVESAMLRWVQGESVAYALNLRGRRDQFYEYLELGGRLARVMPEQGFISAPEAPIAEEAPAPQASSWVDPWLPQGDGLDIFAPAEMFGWGDSDSVFVEYYVWISPKPSN